MVSEEITDEEIEIDNVLESSPAIVNPVHLTDKKVPSKQGSLKSFFRPK